MKTIKGEKVPLTDVVTDYNDILAKEDIGGTTDHNRFSVDLSVLEERNRLLSIRADINDQLNKALFCLKDEREKLNNWNLKVSEFKSTMSLFTFSKFRYTTTTGYPFDSPDEKRLLFGALCLAEEWGNREYHKQERELAKLEKQRNLHYENVQVLKGNIELLKSSSYELSLKLKGSRKADKSLN